MRHIPLPNPERVAAILAEVADDEILPLFRKLEHHEIQEKDAGELVTHADINAEGQLTKALTGIVHGSKIIGEEGFTHDPKMLDFLGGEDPVWVIDPVDGTHNFVHGDHKFCVILSYCVGEDVIMGWIYDPCGERTVIAMKGEGVYENGTRLRVGPAPERLGEMTVALRPRMIKRLKERVENDPGLAMPKRTVYYRCIGHEYMELARGDIHFARYGSLKPWDHAAGVLMHMEAGGYHELGLDNGPYRTTIHEGGIRLASDERTLRETNRLLER